MLAKELPNGRLLEADSLMELRMHPERLTGEIAGFLTTSGSPAGARPRIGPSGRPNVTRGRVRLSGVASR